MLPCRPALPPGSRGLLSASGTLIFKWGSEVGHLGREQGSLTSEPCPGQSAVTVQSPTSQSCSPSARAGDQASGMRLGKDATLTPGALRS